MKLRDAARLEEPRCDRQTPSVMAICLTVGLAWAALACSPTWAQVVEEESVVTEEGVVDEAAEGPSGGWIAVEVRKRKIGDAQGYIRQATEAFVDPDQPRALEPKYYFLLDDEPLDEDAGSFQRGPVEPMQLEAGESAGAAEWKELFPLRLPPSVDDVRSDVEWVDYFGKPGPRQAAVLLAVDKHKPARLLSLRVEPREAGGWELKKVLGQREIPAEAVPDGAARAGLLDTFDRPAGLSAKAAMFGRMIAVLKQIEGRYVVDFYSEKLAPESDCRLGLTPVEHRFGRALAIRFVELPLRRPDGTVADKSVLSVTYRDRLGKQTRIAVDYPLLSPPLVEQFRKMQAQAKPGANAPATQPDLGKVLGEEVLEEFESRLVNAPYR